MRHNVYGKHLGRSNNERLALFRGLVRSLFLNGSISTTEPKAKAIKGLVDKLITAGKKNNQATKRIITSFLSESQVEDRLMKEIVPVYSERTSGFTTTTKLGRRVGDGAMMVKVSLIESGSKEKKEIKKEGKDKKEE